MNRTAKYIEVAKINAAEMIQHIANLLGRGGVTFLRVWIFAQLYEASYAASGVTTINGLGVSSVVWLLVFTQAFRNSAWPPAARLIDEEVKSGLLAYSINRPYSYALFHLSAFLGRTVPNLVMNIGLSVVAGLLFAAALHVTWSGVAAGGLLLVMSLLLDYSLMFIIGLSAFWIEDTSAFQWMYFKGQLVFGGLLFPLALFPEPLKSIAEVLPFAQMYYSAARMLVKFDPVIFERFLFLQFVWLGIFSFVGFLIFRKGQYHVAINGG